MFFYFVPFQKNGTTLGLYVIKEGNLNAHNQKNGIKMLCVTVYNTIEYVKLMDINMTTDFVVVLGDYSLSNCEMMSYSNQKVYVLPEFSPLLLSDFS
ncbi:MAG TPA: hypothetical protein DCW31_03785 [Lactobacillus sp.]|nr:hypothetical protein [Lactobacillus sp.]